MTLVYWNTDLDQKSLGKKHNLQMHIEMKLMGKARIANPHQRGISSSRLKTICCFLLILPFSTSCVDECDFKYIESFYENGVQDYVVQHLNSSRRFVDFPAFDDVLIEKTQEDCSAVFTIYCCIGEEEEQIQVWTEKAGKSWSILKAELIKP
jgi:hypothetical protein